MELHKLWAQATQPLSESLLETLWRKIRSGELTEDTPLSSMSDYLDSLERVELIMEAEELGVSTERRLETVGDLIQFLKAMNFRRNRRTTKGSTET